MALSPDEIVVVANRNAKSSLSLAEYYMEKRQIPQKNLILIWATDKEMCSREDYDKKIAAPVRRHIQEDYRPYEIRCIVTIYGVPLRIGSSEYPKNVKEELIRLKDEKSALTQRIEASDFSGASEKKQINRELKRLDTTLRKLRFNNNRGAALDSELSLVLATDYNAGGWTRNPYFVGFQPRNSEVEKKDVLMVSRLDGQTPEIVRRIVDDSIKTEEEGLSGVAYIDARWPDPGDGFPSGGYAKYDKSLHRAADIIRESDRMPVIVDDTPQLFAPGQCKTAALYCGWYRLAHYVDSFEWQPGSVGYHIASSECGTLRNPNSQVWCKRMLEEGVAATIGPVSEPYIESFPPPEIFFKYLTEGALSLAECYILSVPYLSWKQVLVGDPLYRPFKAIDRP